MLPSDLVSVWKRLQDLGDELRWQRHFLVNWGLWKLQYMDSWQKDRMWDHFVRRCWSTCIHVMPVSLTHECNTFLHFITAIWGIGDVIAGLGIWLWGCTSSSFWFLTLLSMELVSPGGERERYLLDQWCAQFHPQIHHYWSLQPYQKQTGSIEDVVSWALCVWNWFCLQMLAHSYCKSTSIFSMSLEQVMWQTAWSICRAKGMCCWLMLNLIHYFCKKQSKQAFSMMW